MSSLYFQLRLPVLVPGNHYHPAMTTLRISAVPTRPRLQPSVLLCHCSHNIYHRLTCHHLCHLPYMCRAHSWPGYTPRASVGSSSIPRWATFGLFITYLAPALPAPAHMHMCAYMFTEDRVCMILLCFVLEGLNGLQLRWAAGAVCTLPALLHTVAFAPFGALTKWKFNLL